MKKLIIIIISVISLNIGFAQNSTFITIGQGSYVTIDGQKFAISGTNLGQVILAETADGNYALVIKNLPVSKTIEVDIKKYDNQCNDCVYVQLSDKSGNTYIATSGKFTNNPGQIKFNLTLTNILDINTQMQTHKPIKLTGLIIKAGLADK